MGIYRRPLSPAHRLRQNRARLWVGTSAVVAPTPKSLVTRRRATAMGAANLAFHRQQQYNRQLRGRRLRQGSWVGTKPYVPSLTPPVTRRKTRVSTTNPFRRQFVKALQLQQLHRRRWIGTLAPAITSFYTAAITDNPAHYWRMGAASGNEPDVIASKDLVLAGGVTRDVAGAITVDDGAIAFDGTDGTAQTADPLALQTTALTIECYIKPGTYNSSDDDLLWEYPSVAWFSVLTSFVCDLNNSSGGAEANTISIGCRGGADGIIRGTILQSDMPAGAWHHFVVVYIVDGTGPGVIKAYVDGSAVTVTMRDNIATTTPFDRGAIDTNKLSLMSRNAASLFAAGSLDEVLWYDSELSAERVLAHYVAGLGGDAVAPVPTVTSVDVTKISRISGKDVATIVINTDENYVEYELRVVPSSGSGRGAGTQIETAVVGSRNTDTLTITDDEFVAASASEGTNIVKLFVKDVAGNWSS